MADVFHNLSEVADFVNANLAKVPRNQQSAANSLIVSFSQRPEKFSEKQAAYLRSIAQMVSPQKSPPKTVSLGDFARVIELFDTAANNGLKRPKIRLQKNNGEKVVLSVASSTARFPGTINVSDGGPFGESIFYGRVTREGEFQEQNASSADVRELLRELASDPKNIARLYGRKTGLCCCCGRELTDAISVKNGIGPICETKFGM